MRRASFSTAACVGAAADVRYNGMLAAVVLAGVTLFVGLTQTGINDSTRVVGRVTYSPRRPASTAFVTATSDSEIAQTRVDAHGNYAFLTLIPGVYRLTACEPRSGRLYDLVKPTNHGPEAVDEEDSLVELSAGVEYLANLTVTGPCH